LSPGDTRGEESKEAQMFIEVPGVGAVNADLITVVGALKAGATKKDPKHYEVGMVGPTTVVVADGDMPRSELIASLTGDYVPAGQRTGTGGVRLASSEPRPGGVR
jgi:hypothetical protein